MPLTKQQVWAVTRASRSTDFIRSGTILSTCGVSRSAIRKQASVWCSLLTILCCLQQRSPRSIKSAGLSNCFSNGSSKIYASNISTSENAVKTQIWIAVCVYVLAAIIKKELALEVSLYTFLQILSVHSFEKTQLVRAFLDTKEDFPLSSSVNQLTLFEN